MRFGRLMLSIAGFTYALFHAALGLIWATEYDESSAAYISLGVYLALAVATMLLYREERLPMPQAVVSLAGTLAIAPLAQAHLASNHITDYSTWYVMGIGMILSALALRGHILMAAAGMLASTIEIMNWAGWGNFFASGLLGPIMLLLGTSIVTVGLRRAATETELYSEQNAAAAAAAAASATTSTQRSSMMRETLARTRPLLEQIAAGAALDDDSRQEARLTEAALRDEIRGRDLMSAGTRAAIYSARKRGVVVSVLDDGGLAQLTHEQVATLHRQIVESLESLSSGKVTIRAPKGEAWAVTIAAFDDGATAPRVWQKLEA